MQYSELYEQTDIDDADRALLKAIRGLKFTDKANTPDNEGESKAGCGGSIISTSVLVFSLTMTALVFLVIKRKEKYNHEK